MDRSVLIPMLAACGAMVASPAYAQVGIANTISNNNAVFTLQDYTGGQLGNGAGATFSVDGFLGPSAMSQAWWWGRVQGSDPREFAISVSNAVSSFAVSKPASGDEFTISYFYNRVVSGGSVPVLRVDLNWRVAGYGLNENNLPYGQLFQTATVTNLTGTGANNPATTFTYNLFNYNDLGVMGPLSESATQINPSTIRFVDGSDPFNRVDYNVQGPNAVMRVTANTGSSRVRSLLTNSTATTLAAGIVGSPGDLEVASQFTFSLAAGQSQSATITLTVPSPGAVALVGLGGLLALGPRSRRRR